MEASSASALTWVNHPARERPALLAMATAIILLFTLLVLWAEGNPLMAVTCAAVLLLSIAPFLLPTRYTLNRRGVFVAMPGLTRSRPWEELRRWEEDGGGVLLSPFAQPRPFLDRRRGLYLRGGDREAIRGILEARLGPAHGGASRPQEKGRDEAG